MNAKQFEKKVKELYKKYNAIESNFGYKVYIQTKYGKMFISSDYTPHIKVASIHSLVKAETEQLKAFKDETGYNIDTYNGKCNFYNESPEFILDTLEDYLQNLTN